METTAYIFYLLQWFYEAIVDISLGAGLFATGQYTGLGLVVESWCKFSLLTSTDTRVRYLQVCKVYEEVDSNGDYSKKEEKNSKRKLHW